MQHDEQENELRIRGVLVSHEPGREDDMSGAGDRQQLGRALNQRQDQDLNIIHCFIDTGRAGGSPILALKKGL